MDALFEVKPRDSHSQNFDLLPISLLSAVPVQNEASPTNVEGSASLLVPKTQD